MSGSSEFEISKGQHRDDGADEASFSSVRLTRENDRPMLPLFSLRGGKISDGGDVGGDIDGLYTGDSGAV